VIEGWPPTPELDKQQKVIKSGQAGTVQEFIDWLLENGYQICTREDYNPDSNYWPIAGNWNSLMARFFDLDEDKIEQERRAVLDYIDSLKG
jgi:hypothetical protein